MTKWGKEIWTNVVPILISLLAAVIATASLVYTISKDHNQFAPFLCAINEELVFGNYYFDPELGYDTSPMSVTLDKRILLHREENSEGQVEETKEAHNVFILDVNRNVNSTLWGLENFGIFTLQNVGYPMISMEVEKVEILLENGNILSLAPTSHNKMSAYLNTGDTIRFFVSYFQAEADLDLLFDSVKLEDESYLEMKMTYTDDNLLNTYMPVSADLYQYGKCYIKVTNVYGEVYKQCIELQNDGLILTPISYFL